ncbi:MAG: macro domain-containing protein, partial [Thermomicrobiales bacterium]
TLVRSVYGEIIDQPVQAVVYVANSRGMMEAGSPAAIRLIGGAEVEREAMALAPHRIGTLFVTGPGRLKQRGIEFIFHIVLSNMLGEQPKRNLIARSLTNVLEAAEQRRVHSIAIPIIGATMESSTEDRTELIDSLVEATVSHLRRHNSRFDTISFVSRFPDDAPLVAASLEQARKRSWVE